ncbi:CpsD/CapB family tyrosine-protein kinase [Phenylobacterium sp. SCN 70-31]|uniref:CpsD/CapB family tyrosine-protein kinase n=1 Tax=Phenylobacterium sp. SCN 70-31 TaxID=1660129 RepID=UPI0025E5F9E6|nr:CpsD/CapB family tyrosine-protein kinase [Phenylobacterium sp. SCN 70-31]
MVLSDPHGPQASAIRSIAAELDARHFARGHRGLAVCGVSRAVGVTFMTVNIGIALAQQGLSVLIIDANQRNSGLQSLIEPAKPSLGLADLLSNSQLSLNDVIHADVLPNLSLVYAGLAVEGREMLGSEMLRKTLEAAMRDHDLTLVDTPAANLSAEARRVASVLRYAVVVARKNQTFAEDITTLVREFGEDGVDVVGTVLNAT